jgi:uncharacterized protein (DUF2147 family)
MKKLVLRLVAVTTLIAPATGFASDTPIYGVWGRDGHPTDKLEFYDCSGKLCAKGVLPMADGSPPPIVLRSAAKTGPNAWKGDLFNPEDGKTYTGKIAYEPPDQFTLTGCLVAFLCQSETWTRVSGPPKPKTEPKAESKAEAKGDGKAEAKGDAKADAKSSDDGGHGGHGADKTSGAAKPATEGAKASGAATPPAGAEPAKAHKPARAGETKPAAAKPAAPKTAPAHPKPPEEEGN